MQVAESRLHMTRCCMLCQADLVARFTDIGSGAAAARRPGSRRDRDPERRSRLCLSRHLRSSEILGSCGHDRRRHSPSLRKKKPRTARRDNTATKALCYEPDRIRGSEGDPRCGRDRAASSWIMADRKTRPSDRADGDCVAAGFRYARSLAGFHGEGDAASAPIRRDTLHGNSVRAFHR